MRRCVRITRFVRRVGAEASALPMYEGFPNLASFLEEFEEKVIEIMRLSALDYELKAIPARWWGTHKQSISKWLQCRILIQIIFDHRSAMMITNTQDWEHIHDRNGFTDSSTPWKWCQKFGTPQRNCDKEPLNGKYKL